MKKVKIYHYDAFSSQPNKGNPAGFVLKGENFTEEEMLQIAAKVGFNETTFLYPSNVADLRLRYFTPGHEMNLCGHATMASIYALKTMDLLPKKDHLMIETKAGVLPIKVLSNNEDVQISMKQAAPQFIEFKGSHDDLAKSINIDAKDIANDLPVMYGSTGIWTLLVPIKNLEAFHKMKPTNTLFPTILKEMPKASIHPFCLETYDNTANMHARHFSSPYSGTIEDPVTGTASGVMGAYYARYIDKLSDQLELLVEQGQEMDKDGRVHVTVTKNHDSHEVEITGTARFVKEFDIDI